MHSDQTGLPSAGPPQVQTLSTPNWENVDQLVDANVPWNQLRPYFATREEMLAHVAARRSLVYGAANVSDNCSLCGNAGNSQLVNFTWEYRKASFALLPALLEVAVGHLPICVSTPCFRFDTYHRFCPMCERLVMNRYTPGTLLWPFALFLTAAGAMLSITWAIVMLCTWGNPTEATQSNLIGNLGLPMLAIGLPASRLVYRLRIPAVLRPLSRRPISLHRARRSNRPQ